MQRFPAIREHVIEHISPQLLYPVLDHPMRNEDAPHCVGVMVGDTEEAGAITCYDLSSL